MMKSSSTKGPHRQPTIPKAPPLDLSSLDPPFSPKNPQLDQRQRLFGLTTAPTFRPTIEEFADPLKYIEKIRVEGELTGICKIVPPEGWKPDFAMDTQTFWFRPRIMRLNSMEGSSRAILNYLDQLQKFHTQQGTQFTRIPMLDKKPINLFELKKEVAKRGGYHNVTATKQWAQVGRAIGVGGKTCTSLSHSIKAAYTKWVYPYEDFIAKHGSPAPTRPGTPDLGQQDSDGTPTTRGKRAKREKKLLKPIPVPPPAPSVESGSSSPSPKKAVLPTGYKPKPGLELCEICGGGENDEKMLLCDGCNRGYHLYCFDPPMAAIPTTDWFCPDCLRVSGQDYGFEEGEVRSLYHFQKVANGFKEKHFRERFGVKEGEKVVVTEDEVEREFWRLVESPYDDVEVEYGADLHSSQHGSGFPVPEKQPTNPYSTCGWNLNNIPVLPSSLFTNIRNDISGMMIPWLYVGMIFSTFCWHTEDHYTYSINYLHWGETKTWYGIPASNADKFEQTMQKKVPELFESNPDLLFHLTTMLSPGVLVKEGVEVYAADQRPGEFVITFPRAYHAGFNQGFNFAEAVNFALPNWLPHGLECVKRYAQYHKQPVFSHDELVISTAQRDIDVRTAVWLKKELECLRDYELERREEIQAHYPGIKVVEEGEGVGKSEGDEEGGMQCGVCQKYCFVSWVKCSSCSPREGKGRIVCFDHVDELCTCPTPTPTLHTRYTTTQLSTLVTHITQIASRPSEWKIKYDTILSQTRRPQLKELQKLVKESERIPYEIEEATLLKEFVGGCGEWVERVNRVLHKRKRSVGRRSVSHTMGEGDEEEVKPGGGSGERTLENIEKLLHEAEDLNFDCPEIKLLENLEKQVIEFRDKARAVLGDPGVTVQKINEVQEWGSALDIWVGEIEELEDKVEELEWGGRVSSLLDSQSAETTIQQLDYETVVNLMDEGRGFGVRADHPLMVKLKTLKHQGDEWRILAAGVVKQKRVSLGDVREVLEKGSGGVVIGELWEKVTGMVEGVQVWREQVKKFIPGVVKSEEGEQEMKEEGDEMVERCPTEKLFELLKEIESSPVRLEELSTLQQDGRRVTEWLGKAKRILKVSGNKSLEDIVGELEGNVGRCTRVEDHEGEQVFCICRTRRDEGLMIECESCHTWYHTSCVRLTKKLLKKATSSTYTCPICDPSKPEFQTKVKKASLEHIRTLVRDGEEVEGARYVVGGLEVLKGIVNLVEGWVERVEGMLQKEEWGEGGTVLKRFLRCGEGLGVGVEGVLGKLREKVVELYPICHNNLSENMQEQDTQEGDTTTQTQHPHPPPETGEKFCLCKETRWEDDGAMIGCDECSGWYHFKCVGLEGGEVERIERYVCPVCVERKGEKVKKITLKLGEGGRKRKSVGDVGEGGKKRRKGDGEGSARKRKKVETDIVSPHPTKKPRPTTISSNQSTAPQPWVPTISSLVAPSNIPVHLPSEEEALPPAPVSLPSSPKVSQDGSGASTPHVTDIEYVIPRFYWEEGQGGSSSISSSFGGGGGASGYGVQPFGGQSTPFGTIPYGMGQYTYSMTPRFGAAPQMGGGVPGTMNVPGQGEREREEMGYGFSFSGGEGGGNGVVFR